MNESPVSNVSDTARWVAVYRAWETARTDALFRDPFAQRLAGAHGRSIAALVPSAARNGWPLIARTRLIDDLCRQAIARGCDCIVNLAAGFDTRPYRLELPAQLDWVEADLPDLIAEKEQALEGVPPRCRLRRLRVDLADGKARAGALREAVGPARSALVITEGLLVYLDATGVSELAADLAAQAAIGGWILDIASPALIGMMQRSMGAVLRNAPMRFAPPEGVGFFESRGWSVESVASVLHAAARWRRLPWPLRPFALLPPANPRRLGRAPWSAVVHLTRPQLH